MTARPKKSPRFSRISNLGTGNGDEGLETGTRGWKRGRGAGNGDEGLETGDGLETGTQLVIDCSCVPVSVLIVTFHSNVPSRLARSVQAGLLRYPGRCRENSDDDSP